MKPVTCGIVIRHQDEILIGHPTNHGWDHCSIPKGIKEDGETPAECAIRECYEECGIQFAWCELADGGRYPYIKEKDLHVFVAYLSEKPKNLKCTSYFMDKDGTEKPEFDELLWIKVEDIPKYVAKSLSSILLNKILNSDDI